VPSPSSRADNVHFGLVEGLAAFVEQAHAQARRHAFPGGAQPQREEADVAGQQLIGRLDALEREIGRLLGIPREHGVDADAFRAQALGRFGEFGTGVAAAVAEQHQVRHRAPAVLAQIGEQRVAERGGFAGAGQRRAVGGGGAERGAEAPSVEFVALVERGSEATGEQRAHPLEA
jgi:hypothetical protein